MITGRGPGAPGVTPGPEFTGGRATAGGTGDQAADLGEIRRSEEAINVLAARGAAGPDLTHDPALALLGALVADVDTPGTLAGRCADVLGDLRHAHAPHIRPARRRHAQGRHAHGPSRSTGLACTGVARPRGRSARRGLAGPGHAVPRRGRMAAGGGRGRSGSRPGQRHQPDRHQHAGPADPGPGPGASPGGPGHPGPRPGPARAPIGAAAHPGAPYALTNPPGRAH